MPSHNETICDNEKITNSPPVVRTVKLEYPSILDKVELEIKFDSENFVGCILHPNKPIEINGERIPIPNLPSEPVKLKFVKLSGIDVTKYVKSSPQGELNKIVVNYKVRDKPWFFDKFGNKIVGTLNLVLTVHWSEGRRLCEKGHEIPSGEMLCRVCHPSNNTKRYCMWHGEDIPPTSKLCPFVPGWPRFVDVLTPNTIKTCPNPACPNKTIHISEIYCEHCGTKQPPSEHNLTPPKQ